MKPVRTIAAVGVAPDLLEELKHAVEASALRLDAEWRWGSEQNPDLLVIDPSDFAARMTRTRAQVTGVRYVVVGDAAKHATDRFVLLRPYRSDAIAAVLNAAGPGTVSASDFATQDDSFYTLDFESDGASEASGSLPAELPATRTAPALEAASGLDEMIRGDPLAGPVPDPAKVRLPTDASIDTAGGGGTLRSAVRREQTLDRMRRAGAPDEGDPQAYRVGAPAGTLPGSLPPDGSHRRLEQYLSGESLGGPVRIARDGAPVLAVDPKQRLFHATGDLSALLPYCEGSWGRGDWQALTSSELQAVRESEPARPYAHLLWLCALQRSEGRLASHLDPGGTFHVAQPVAVDPGFHGHGAIAAALSQPRRLHEVAAAAEVPMEQVFDVVNAYDAVGLLQWTPRPPRHAPPSAPEPRGGLLSRIAGRLRRK